MNASPALSSADRLWLFDELAEDLRAFAEKEGASYSDSISICALIRNAIYLKSSSATSIELQEECEHLARRQVAINTIFTRLYTKKSKLMISGVRSGLGSLASSPEFDIENIATTGWTYLLKRLTAGTVTLLSDKAESGFVRACGKNCGWAAAQNYRRRLKLAQLNHTAFNSRPQAACDRD